jgi:hypothetical protein
VLRSKLAHVLAFMPYLTVCESLESPSFSVLYDFGLHSYLPCLLFITEMLIHLFFFLNRFDIFFHIMLIKSFHIEEGMVHLFLGRYIFLWPAGLG